MPENRQDLQVSRRFDAPAERVYDAWLTPELARQFLFATPTGTIVRADIDARVGGGFTVVDRRGGEDVLHAGTYVELTRPSRLRFTFGVPQYSGDLSEVVIDIAPDGDGCVLRLTQPGTLAQYHDLAVEGWTGVLDRAANAIGVTK